MNMHKRSLFAVFFVVFLDNFGFSIVFSMMGPLLLLPDYGMLLPSHSEMMRNILLAVIYGIFPLTQFFGAPILGDFADKFGRKKTLYFSIGGTALGYFLSGLAIGMHSVTLLFLSRLFTGFFAGNLSISLAAIADLSIDEKHRARNFGKVTTLFGFSWILAMIMGGYLANPAVTGSYGPMGAFIVTGILSLVNFVAIALWFQETHRTHENFQVDLMGGIHHVIAALKLKEVRLYYIIYVLWVVGWGTAVQWFTPYSIQIHHATVDLVTTWMIILGLTWTLGSSVFNNALLKRLHSLTIATTGMVITAVLILVCYFVPWYFAFGALLSIAAIPSAFTMSNTMNMISMSAPADVQGKVMGLSQSMLSLGWIITSILTAIMADRLIFLYLLCAIALFIGFGIYLYKFLGARKSGVYQKTK